MGPDLIHWRGLSESPDTGPGHGLRTPTPSRLAARCAGEPPAYPGAGPIRSRSGPVSRVARHVRGAKRHHTRRTNVYTAGGAGGWELQRTGLAGSGRDAATGERDCGKRRRTRTGTGDGRGSRPPPPACASPVPATSSQQRVAGTRAGRGARTRGNTRGESAPFSFQT